MPTFAHRPSPAALQLNIKLFVMFRILFSARFYYPVLAVLFLDYGLTLEQFAILNAIWAAAIMMLEVPSGALADRWGRKRLVQWASWLMVLGLNKSLNKPPKHSPNYSPYETIYFYNKLKYIVR